MRIETQKVLMSVTVPEEDNNGISQSFAVFVSAYYIIPHPTPNLKQINLFQVQMCTNPGCLQSRSVFYSGAG